MKLLLASLASQTLDLVLPLLPDDPSKLKLAFIPTAADPYPTDQRPWFDADYAKVVAIGFQTTICDIKNKDETILRNDLSQFDVIYVEGGNSYYLLNIVRESGFDTVIKELIAQGKVYIGSSAGSCIMCPTIEHVEFVEHQEMGPKLTDYTGLGLINNLIMPHYGREKYAKRHAKTKEKWGDKLTFLRDDQTIMVDDDKSEKVTKK